MKGERSAPKGRAGPAFCPCILLRMRGFLFEKIGENPPGFRIGLVPETARPPFWKGDGGARGLDGGLFVLPSSL